MSITMMCSETAEGAWAFLPDEAKRQGWNTGDAPYTERPMYMHEFAQGCVVSLRERNGYDDSDFIATVYLPGLDALGSVEYATTRGWTYCNHATVDATPEVLAKVAAVRERQAAKARADKAARDAMRAEPGKLAVIEITRGKHKHLNGTECEITWFNIDGFKTSRWATFYRVGVRLIDGTVLYFGADNVRVKGAAKNCAEAEREHNAWGKVMAMVGA